jgi:ElaB/YqjD/DUF883 family membrane-anchored ribosome-binding protein
MATANQDTAAEFEAEMAAIRSDLAALREDIAAVARTAAAAAQQQKDRAVEALEGKADDLMEKGEEMIAGLGREVEARPLMSVAAAFGIGFMLGKLLDRR